MKSKDGIRHSKKRSMKPGMFTEEDVLGLARKAYQEGNAAFDIVAEKCALLVIDKLRF